METKNIPIPWTIFDVWASGTREQLEPLDREGISLRAHPQLQGNGSLNGINLVLTGGKAKSIRSVTLKNDRRTLTVAAPWSSTGKTTLFPLTQEDLSVFHGHDPDATITLELVLE